MVDASYAYILVNAGTLVRLEDAGQWYPPSPTPSFVGACEDM